MILNGLPALPAQLAENEFDTLFILRKRHRLASNLTDRGRHHRIQHVAWVIDVLTDHLLEAKLFNGREDANGDIALQLHRLGLTGKQLLSWGFGHILFPDKRSAHKYLRVQHLIRRKYVIDVHTPMTYIPRMKIVRTALFERSLKKLNATKADIDALEASISANPLAGDVIPGLRGIRKIRFAMGGKGKRGGGRAIYFILVIDELVFLLTAYGKAEQEDLSERQKKELLMLIDEVMK